MKVLQCEMCGSRDLVKQDGVFVCQACGTKYSVEDARKMMVEGTVQVAGTVKVDKSEELKNLYILAERARKSNNSDNAVRYYNQILEKDPNSWQANFYLVYFKAKNTNVGSIPNVCYDLINCYQSTFELLIEDKGEDINAELEMLIEDVYNYSISIVNSTWGMHEFYTYQGKALEILSMFGDKLVDIYGDTYKKIAIKAWKKGMDVYQNILNSCENRDIAESNARLIAFAFNVGELQDKIRKHTNSIAKQDNLNGDKVQTAIGAANSYDIEDEDADTIQNFENELQENLRLQEQSGGHTVCTDFSYKDDGILIQVINTNQNGESLNNCLNIFLALEEQDYEHLKELEIGNQFACAWDENIERWYCCLNMGKDYSAASKMIASIAKDVFDISDVSLLKTNTWKDGNQGMGFSLEKIKAEKKKIAIIALIIIAFVCFLVFLGNDNLTVENTESSDYIEPQQTIENNESWIQDNPSIVNRKTYDLTFFEVHGPVKEIVENGKTYKFDEEGNLIRIDDYNPFSDDIFGDEYSDRCGYKRDDKGRICTKFGWESGVEYHWEDDHIVSDEWSAESYSGTDLYFYDNRGFIVKNKTTDTSEGDDEIIRKTINYSYPVIDEFGNWTYRTGGDYNRHRTIRYYQFE